MEKELTFKLRKIFNEVAVEHGLSISQDRFQMQQLEDSIRLMLLLATQEEEAFDYPVNFLTKLGQKWQNLKAKLPKRLRRLLPLEVAHVWAVHSFPSVNVPIEFVGSEYVSFRVIPEKELHDDGSSSK